MTLTCQRCGGPMPDLPDDLAKILASGAAVELVHAEGLCEGETPPPPEGRYFEVRCEIVEITDRTETVTTADGSRTTIVGEGVDADELASFRAGVRAADLDAAMRPLAEALGAKWLEVEKHARLADPRSVPGS